MKKRISTAIYMATREVFLDYFGVVGKIALVAVLGIFLGANIFLSETVHPLYFEVVNEKRSAVVAFLQKIKNLPSDKHFLSMNTIIFGPSLVAEVQKETIDRQKKIQSYLLLLHKNPNSRDLLYALSDLYRENGQSDLAHEYLLKAQSIDPTVR